MKANELSIGSYVLHQGKIVRVVSPKPVSVSVSPVGAALGKADPFSNSRVKARELCGIPITRGNLPLLGFEPCKAYPRSVYWFSSGRRQARLSWAELSQSWHLHITDEALPGTPVLYAEGLYHIHKLQFLLSAYEIQLSFTPKTEAA